MASRTIGSQPRPCLSAQNVSTSSHRPVPGHVGRGTVFARDPPGIPTAHRTRHLRMADEQPIPPDPETKTQTNEGKKERKDRPTLTGREILFVLAISGFIALGLFLAAVFVQLNNDA